MTASDIAVNDVVSTNGELVFGGDAEVKPLAWELGAGTTGKGELTVVEGATVKPGKNLTNCRRMSYEMDQTDEIHMTNYAFYFRIIDAGGDPNKS